jgi:hypothetical protein
VLAVGDAGAARHKMLRLTMMPPCFRSLRNKPCGQGTWRPASIENVPPRAAAAERGHERGGLSLGEWYLNVSSAVDPVGKLEHETRATLYYAPVEGDAMNVLRAVLPVAHRGLVRGTAGLRDFSVHNVTFEHDTWLRPSGPEGYVEQQSGGLVDSSNWNLACEAGKPRWSPAEGSVHFSGPRGLVMEGCTFRHLGGPSAVSLMHGAHDSMLRRLHFYDVSGTAFQLGNNRLWRSDTAVEERELRNTLTDSLIEWVAQEFRGQVGVSVAHAAFTTLSRLTIRNVTHGGGHFLFARLGSFQGCTKAILAALLSASEGVRYASPHPQVRWHLSWMGLGDARPVRHVCARQPYPGQSHHRL